MSDPLIGKTSARLTHQQVWEAIDALAERNGLTASALAKRAGLDATTFNKSKRTSADGRLRWPSTESISKILDATGSSIDEFLGLVAAQAQPARRTIPLLGLAQAGSGGFFDDGGFPVGSGWDEVNYPNVADEHAYALEISGDSMSPVYRDGDTIIVSPGAAVRRGDRVVVKTTEGEVLAKELRRRTAKTVELKSLNREHEDRVLGVDQVSWIARIMWSSQ
jgi:phage repressor protein C with HTH and peptisase S24 domain